MRHRTCSSSGVMKWNFFWIPSASAHGRNCEQTRMTATIGTFQTWQPDLRPPTINLPCVVLNSAHRHQSLSHTQTDTHRSRAANTDLRAA
eukprot:786064-Rhodomonas_salina.5